MIAGFCIRSLKDKSVCSSSTLLLELEEDDVKDRFIELQDRGGLSYPNSVFSAFVKKVFSCLEVLREQTLRKRNVVKFWLDILKPNLPDFMVCGCKDSSHSAKIQEIVLRHLVKVYVVNACSVENDAIDKPKYKVKPLSKKVKKL